MSDWKSRAKPVGDWRSKYSTAEQAPKEDNSGNARKLSELASISSPGGEWSLPSNDTLADPTVKDALKTQAQIGLSAGAQGAAAEIPALTGTALRRMGTSGAINAAANPDAPLRGFLTGAGSTAVAEGAGKLIDGVSSGARNVRDAYRAYKNPDLAREAARDALNTTGPALLEKEGARTVETMRGKSANINPRDYMGYDNDADAILSKYAANETTPIVQNSGQAITRPLNSEVEMPLEDVYSVRKALDRGNFRGAQGAQINMPPNPKSEEAFRKANDLRSLIRGSGGADTSEAIDELRGVVQDSQAMQRGGKFNPTKYFENPDQNRLGLMRSADKELGSNLTGLSKTLSRSGKMHEQTLPGKGMTLLGGGLEGTLDGAVNGSSSATSRTLLPALLNLLGK